jgi:hypothetical protein
VAASVVVPLHPKSKKITSVLPLCAQRGIIKYDYSVTRVITELL